MREEDPSGSWYGRKATGGTYQESRKLEVSWRGRETEGLTMLRCWQGFRYPCGDLDHQMAASNTQERSVAEPLHDIVPVKLHETARNE